VNRTFIIVGAVLLAAASSPAFAQGRPYAGGYGYYGGYGYEGPGMYRGFVRQLRECQRHARVHQELDAEHAMEHAQGLEGPDDHHDLHDALDAAHDAYHQNHPGSDVCDAMGMGAYGAAPYAYRQSYGPSPLGWPGAGSGSGFSFRMGF
jgi:hypothetical protein